MLSNDLMTSGCVSSQMVNLNEHRGKGGRDVFICTGHVTKLTLELAKEKRFLTSLTMSVSSEVFHLGCNFKARTATTSDQFVIERRVR